jgi:hypothetical protein
MGPYRRFHFHCSFACFCLTIPCLLLTLQFKILFNLIILFIFRRKAQLHLCGPNLVTFFPLPCHELGAIPTRVSGSIYCLTQTEQRVASMGTALSPRSSPGWGPSLCPQSLHKNAVNVNKQVAEVSTHNIISSSSSCSSSWVRPCFVCSCLHSFHKGSVAHSLSYLTAAWARSSRSKRPEC